MSELAGSWAVGAFTEPQDGESPISADDVRANDNAVRGGFNNHDADGGLHLQGSVLASRPSAGTAGRKWFTSDTKQLFRDNGSTWDEADYLNLTNGGTVAGAATFSGGLTSTAGSRTLGATTFTGTITGAGASFSSAISAAGGTFTSALTGTSATFSGTLAGTSGTFSGALAATNLSLGTPSGTAGTLALKESVAHGYAITLQNRNATQLWGIAVDKIAIDDAILNFDNITAGVSRMSLSTAGILTVDGGVAIGTTPAASGAIRMANTGAIIARNGGNTADIGLISLDGTNVLRLGVTAGDVADIYWSKPLVALGGGAAPTLGTIGGTGPATAAQNSWMRVQDSTGATFWVPAWK